MRLSRFSDKLKFQDRADCGNNIKVEENIISFTEPVIPLEINQICVLESSQNVSADV